MNRFACLYQPHTPDGSAPDPASLLATAREFSPRCEQAGSGVVVIDIAGLARMFGTTEAIGSALERDAAARGLAAHVAIAGTRTAALVLARARPGLTMVAPGGEAAALAPLPIDVLERIAPPDPLRDCTRIFTSWGLRTLGDLAALPPAGLAARLGRTGLLWQAMARGEDRCPLVPTPPEERFEASLDLDWPIDGLEPLSFVLTRLLEPLAVQLERRDRGAAVLRVALRLVSRETHERSLQLPAPIRDARTLRTLALIELESHPPAAAIERVTIVIDPTPGRVLQHTLFARAHPAPEALSTLLARLGALLGSDRIGAPAVVDTDRPGAFAMRPFRTDWSAAPCTLITARGAPPPLDNALRRASSLAAGADSLSSRGPQALHPAPCTPVTSALRRLRQPIPARVAIENGRPVRVTSDRSGFEGGGVRACTGPWRTSGDWWTRSWPPSRLRRSGEPSRSSPVSWASGGWNHAEWDVELSAGIVYRIFHDRDRGGWFIDAIAD